MFLKFPSEIFCNIYISNFLLLKQYFYYISCSISTIFLFIKYHPFIEEENVLNFLSKSFTRFYYTILVMKRNKFLLLLLVHFKLKNIDFYLVRKDLFFSLKWLIALTKILTLFEKIIWICLDKSLKKVLMKSFYFRFLFLLVQPITILESIEMKLLKERIRNNHAKNFRVAVWRGCFGLKFFKTIFSTLSHRVFVFCNEFLIFLQQQL